MLYPAAGLYMPESITVNGASELKDWSLEDQEDNMPYNCGYLELGEIYGPVTLTITATNIKPKITDAPYVDSGPTYVYVSSIDKYYLDMRIINDNPYHVLCHIAVYDVTGSQYEYYEYTIYADDYLEISEQVTSSYSAGEIEMYFSKPGYADSAMNYADVSSGTI